MPTRPLNGTDLKRFLRDYRRAHKPGDELVALLQSVEYPANVGSIFRLADGAGVSELILTGITPTPPNATIDKVGRYKSLRLPWRYEADPIPAIEGLRSKGFGIVAIELTRMQSPTMNSNIPKRRVLSLDMRTTE